MNKTERNNKINLVNWPEHNKLFTIKEFWKDLNPNSKEITLRVRLDNAIKKDKTVSVVGYKNTGKGRPIMILAMNPISQELLDKAYADGIQPPEIKPLVTVMEVKSIPTSASETPSDEIDVPVSMSIPSATVVSA